MFQVFLNPPARFARRTPGPALPMTRAVLATRKLGHAGTVDTLLFFSFDQKVGCLLFLAILGLLGRKLF